MWFLFNLWRTFLFFWALFGCLVKFKSPLLPFPSNSCLLNVSVHAFVIVKWVNIMIILFFGCIVKVRVVDKKDQKYCVNSCFENIYVCCFFINFQSPCQSYLIFTYLVIFFAGPFMAISSSHHCITSGQRSVYSCNHLYFHDRGSLSILKYAICWNGIFRKLLISLP